MNTIRTAIVLIAMALAGNAAATNVSGAITTNTTWTLANSPYVVTASVTVNSGVTLTVEPGVVVKFNSGTGMTVTGTLKAIGTATDRITFTSSSATPTAGAWRVLLLQAAATQALTEISYADVSYGGASGTVSYHGNIHVTSGSPILTNVTVSSSSKSGVYATGSSTEVNLSGCTLSSNVEYGVNLNNGAALDGDQVTFTNNTKYAVGVEPGTKVLALGNVTATGNGGGAKNAIEHRGGSVTTAETWRAFGIPWDVTTSVTVMAGTVLTIDPGAVVRFNATSGLAISGTLKAIGTSTSRITFTSTAATPAAGGWRVILLQGPATETVSEISYADVSYGGANGGSTYWGGIHVSQGAPVLTNVTVSNSSKSGVYVTGSSTTVHMTGCTVANNTEYGVNLVSGASLNADQLTITGNTRHAVGVDPGTKVLALSNVTATGNGGGAKNAIEHRGGNVNAAETWRSFNIPWNVTTSVVVGPGAVLTVNPGTVVKFNSLTGLQIDGTLKAIGTSSNRITFTSASASPAPGSWRVILLQAPATQTFSEISYADVSYGGANGAVTYYGNIHVANGAPVLSNVTVSSSSKSGIYATGSSSTVHLSACTLTGSTDHGINLNAGASLDADQTTITNNGKYAVSVEPGATILALSDTVATGNGTGGAKNVIEHRGGTLGASETWAHFDLPWEVTASVTVAAGTVLTIEPGTVVKFGSSAGLAVPGSLQAVGTPGARITLTSAAAVPAPNSWRVILLQAAATEPPSHIAYADVSYGGAAGGATYLGNFHISSGVSVIDHVTVTNASKSGIYVTGSSTSATISYCTLTGNGTHGIEVSGATAGTTIRYSSVAGNTTNGMRNTAASPSFDARFNYWGAASGPSGSGPGTGAVVSAGVLFEPWIVAAPMQEDHYFTTSSHVNRLFNPDIGAASTVSFGTAAEGDWTMEIRDAADNLVKTFTGASESDSVTWDGTNAGNVVVGAGNYTYVISSVDGDDVSATPARGLFVVDLSWSVAVTAISVSEAYFSPNGDTVKDGASVSATTNYQTADWSVEIRNASGTAVRTASSVATGTTLTWLWDGTADDTTVPPSGTYTIVATATVAGSSSSRSVITRLDTVAPAVAISAPAASSTVSNILSNGSFTANVTGSVSDVIALSNWTLDWAADATPSAWTTIATGTSLKTNASLGNWATRELANAGYTLRLRGWDKAGNVGTLATQHTIAHLTASQSPHYIHSVNGGSVTYSSAVPFDVTATLAVKNAAGTTVRTLFSGTRAAGNYTDTWDGKDNGGNVLPDGPYSYVITATAGGSTGTFDESAAMRGTGEQSSHPTVRPTFDPYNNMNQAFTYTIADAYRTVLEVTTIGNYSMNCANRPGCLIDNEYQGPGTYTYQWAGTSRTGAFLTDKNRAGFHYSLARFPRNVTVLYGTKPALVDSLVEPPLYSPSSGQQTVSFDLTTYQSAPAAVTVRFLNQASMSVLRTFSLPQQAAGRVSVTWDGKADNGAWVAPGDYTIMIDATDALGNTATLHAVMSILY